MPRDERESHMCVNPNCCDVCNGLVKENSASILKQTKHCRECYCILMPSEKVCPKCLSDNISEAVEEKQSLIPADKKFCCKHPVLSAVV